MAETMPAVTVASRPQGLPTAIAIWPTRGFSFANVAGVKPSDLDDCDVDIPRGAEHIAGDLLAIGEAHANRLRILHDMGRGHDETVSVDDTGSDTSTRNLDMNHRWKNDLGSVGDRLLDFGDRVGLWRGDIYLFGHCGRNRGRGGGFSCCGLGNVVGIHPENPY